MRVRPQDSTVDMPHRVQQMMVIVPVDAEKDETEHVTQKHGRQRA
jgi:HAMP domain-containing protein